MSPTPICFVDTETTGVHPGRLPWEIALIRRDATGDQETSFFVEVDLENADPYGLTVGRFYERHPAGKYLAGRVRMDEPAPDRGDEYLSEHNAARMVARYTHGAHLIGAVPNFDAEVFDQLLRNFRIVPAWHYHLIDVEAMAVGYLESMRQHDLGENGAQADPIRPPWRSDDLSLACGVEPATDEERHTALGDARWARRLYDAITGGAA